MTNTTATAPYESLATRYRPTRLDDLVGQDSAVKLIRGMLRSGRTVRAMLLSGPYGLGKTTMARLIAAALNCKQPNNSEACGECGPCLETLQSRNPDAVHEINAADARGIDEARKIIATSKYTPRGLRYRVFILDEVHQLTSDAFKSLLKVLEEPPPQTVFILVTTDPAKVPAEIRSRLMRVVMRPLQLEDTVKLVRRVAKHEGTQIPKDVAIKIAQAVRGHARDALVVLESYLNSSAGSEGSEVDIKQIVDDLLGDASDSITTEFVAATLVGDTKAAVRILNRIYNHQIFSESVVRVYGHVVRYSLGDQSLLDPLHSDIYAALEGIKLPDALPTVFGIWIDAAAKLKTFQADPYAVMLCSTVRCCDVVG